MIDRRSREQMCAAIRDYMAKKTSAFELDDAMDSLARSTEDGTVGFVRKLMWFHYDDCKDHKIVVTKQEWDYFNRLLLLLESDAEGEFVKTRGIWGIGFRNLFRKDRPSAAEIAITPFPSVSSILSLRRRVAGFTRKRYPRTIAPRRIRSPLEQTLTWILSGMVIVMFSPILFISLLLPLNQYEPRVRLPRP